MKCVSCGEKFENTVKARGKYCLNCTRKINLKIEWRGHKRTLLAKLLPNKAKRIKKEMDKINAILIKDYGIDMEKDTIDCSYKHIQHK